MRPLRPLLAVGAIAALAAGVAPGFAGSTSSGARFTTPIKLTGAAGGEPSIATDGKGNVIVTGPQGIPSGVNGTPGVGVWTSHNDGTSFGQATLHGSYLGGGDSDITAAPGGVFYLADLEAAATAVCKSTDHGRTFTSVGPVPDPGQCNGVVPGQAGPSNDREWLTTDHKGHLYLTYHEFVSAQPLIFRSDNGGNDLFTAGPCGSIVSDPSIEVNVPTDITGGTLVSKPVTDSAGNVYVMFTTTTQQQNLSGLQSQQPSGTFSQIYLAVSHDFCQTWTDYTVYDGSKLGSNTVQFGDIFNALSIDGAGNLYAVTSGFVGHKAYAPNANVYLFSSHTGGRTWTGPTEVVKGGAQMLPAAVGGPRAGQLAIGYFRTVDGVTDPNSTKAKWTYATAESTDATAARPSFSFADVAPGTVFHTGEICNQGILCGLIPGGPSDRSLLDFTSVTVDGRGCPMFTFAGNPQGVAKGTWNFVTRQTTGCFALPAAAARAALRPAAPPPVRVLGLSESRAVGRLAMTGSGPALPAAGLAFLLVGAAVLVARRRTATG